MHRIYFPVLAGFSDTSFIQNFVKTRLKKLIFSSVKNIGRLRWFLIKSREYILTLSTI